VWDAATLVALLWPSHVTGPFHGLPLDNRIDAVALAIVVPLLWILHRRFLSTRTAHAIVLALLAWKAFSFTALTQDGWCVRVTPSRPYAKGATGAPHSWDIRADWRSPDPSCSAVMTRAYLELHEFPVWFFNLPPPDDNLPSKEDVPPGAHLSMSVRGFFSTTRSGVFEVATGDDITATVYVDLKPGNRVLLAPGVHSIAIDSAMTGDRWALIPRFDGVDAWSRGTMTMKRPSRLDRLFRPWAAWIPLLLVGTLLVTWMWAAIRVVNDPATLLWSAGASVMMGISAATNADRWAVLALAGAALLQVPRRWRTVRGALLCIGVPWLTSVVVHGAPLAGRITLYTAGDDFWQFQRYAYRIVMLGYWLEGGSPTFWFQPLYRWIAGALHLLFGDSSVGEFFWDGWCVLAGALAACALTRIVAGYRWAVIAGVMSLAVFTWSSAHMWLGTGLGEITSGGLIYLAVLAGLRRRSARTGVVSGVLATLGFYTRLNNLIMACGVALFAIPLRVRIADVRSAWLTRIAWRYAIAVVAVLAIGVLLFAVRTWHYTGVFSLFYGTQRDVLSTVQPGMSFTDALSRMVASLMMVLTLHDPAQFDVVALPVLTGAAVMVLSLAGVSRLRTLPLPLVLFALSSCAGALIARGSAYEGRFSVHVIPIMCALTTCAAAVLTRTDRPKSLMQVKI
jgi:hypothetical protein